MIAGSTEPRPQSRDELIPPELAARLDRLDVTSRKMFPGALPGERRSKKRGSSVEFDDYRTYVAGDDLRHIDWNVYARMDRLFIKLFREEEDLAVTVLLDTSASMDAGSPNKLVYSHRLAMGLAYVGLVANNRVSLVTFGSTAGYRRFPAGRGRRRVQAVGEFLLENLRLVADQPNESRVGFNEALQRAARERTGKGVFVVISDCLIREGYEQGLGVLASTSRGGFDTTVVQVMSPGELDPSADGDRVLGDLRLSDAESGIEAEVTVTAELIESYKRRVRAYVDDLSTFCRRRDMKHTLVNTETPPEQVLLRNLRRLGVIGTS
ncbi:MAG: DUF58 domain-containing protein [Planctomycetota bacterium]